MFFRPRVSPILTRRPSSCCDEEVAKLCSRTSLTMVGGDDYGDCDESDGCGAHKDPGGIDGGGTCIEAVSLCYS